MLSNHPATLAQLDPIGIGPDLNRPSHDTGHYRVPFVVEADQDRLGDRGRHRVEAIEPAGIDHQTAALGLDGRPDGLVAELGMAMRLGIGSGPVQHQGIELLIAGHLQTGREVAFQHHPDLVLDLTLLPTRAGVRATGPIRLRPHICRNRRLQARSLPIGMVSTAVFMLSWMPWVQVPLKKAWARS